MNTSDVLRSLIRACVDDERTLQHESTFVDEARGETLARLAHEREQFVTDLERLGQPAQRRPNGSWAELLREAGRNVQVIAAGRNNGDAIAICRHSRARTEARYEDAMRETLPEEARLVIEKQRARLHEETDELNQIQF